MDGVCPGLHICDELHLFRAKFRIQQFFQTAAILRNSIDHIHLFRGKVLISYLCFVQGFKNFLLNVIMIFRITHFIQVTYILKRLCTENWIPRFFCKSHVLQANSPILEIDRIHTKFSTVNLNICVSGKIFFPT